jgi:hypothetical protein
LVKLIFSKFIKWRFAKVSTHRFLQKFDFDWKFDWSVFRMFLLSMNEVNIKYWFRNFQKKIFYRFSGRIRTFYRRKTDLYEKKNSVTCRLPSAICPEKFGSPLLPFPFNLETSPSGLVTDLVLIFGLREQIPSGSSHTNFWLLFHFLVKYWPILMFLGLIWCKILCWAQKSILYGV